MLLLLSLVSRIQTQRSVLNSFNGFKRFHHISKVKLVMPPSMDYVGWANVGKIKKNPGDQVKKSELIMTYEIGKTVIEELALFDGTINEIFVDQHWYIPNGTILYSMKPT